MNKEEYEASLYLAHHGVKGQKWGVRRYQNEDGTLTRKGQKRYGVNLDLNDKSRENIARVRLGEARRRLDVATANNPTNKTRIAEMKSKERAAKKAVSYGKKVDKGAALAAKGRTIWGNQAKKSLAIGAAGLGAALLTYGLNNSLANLSAEGRLTLGHYQMAKAMKTIGTMGLGAAAAAYSIKKDVENSRLRAYNTGRFNGASTIKRIGGEEYQNVLERRERAAVKSSSKSTSSIRDLESNAAKAGNDLMAYAKEHNLDASKNHPNDKTFAELSKRNDEALDALRKSGKKYTVTYSNGSKIKHF